VDKLKSQKKTRKSSEKTKDKFTNNKVLSQTGVDEISINISKQVSESNTTLPIVPDIM